MKNARRILNKETVSTFNTLLKLNSLERENTFRFKITKAVQNQVVNSSLERAS